MSSVNKAIVVGNVGIDPKVRTSPISGKKLASFTMATSEKWKDKETGERKEKTHWHNIVVFNEAIVETVEKYVKKGSKLYVEGQMQTRTWADDSGRDCYITEVVLTNYKGVLVLNDRAPAGQSRGPDPEESDYGTARGPAVEPESDTMSSTATATPRTYADKDDDIPF